jgi:predicted nucleic acid-binding Zn ribbon protein
MPPEFHPKRRFSPRLPPAALDGGLPIGRMIAPLLKTIKLEEQSRLGILIEKWEPAMGKAVAAHTRPGRLFSGELTIFVDSSVWLSELQRYVQREMLTNLQKAFGAETIRKVRLQLDPGK